MNYNKSLFKQKYKRKSRKSNVLVLDWRTHVVQKMCWHFAAAAAAEQHWRQRKKKKKKVRWKGIGLSADFYFKIRLCKLLSIDSKAQTRIILITYLLHFRNENTVKILSTRTHKELSITRLFFLTFFSDVGENFILTEFFFIAVSFYFYWTANEKKKNSLWLHFHVSTETVPEHTLYVGVKEKRNHHT